MKDYKVVLEYEEEKPRILEDVGLDLSGKSAGTISLMIRASSLDNAKEKLTKEIRAMLDYEPERYGRPRTTVVNVVSIEEIVYV